MPLPKSKDFEIAIIGGGISGVILAISLTQRNIPCTIYEKAHAFGEIGAGLGISPNAIPAMKLCDPSIYEAFEKVAQPVLQWDFLDGSAEDNHDQVVFSLGDTGIGSRGCHRAHFLQELYRLLPDGITRFNKQLDSIEESRVTPGKLRVLFHDSTVEEVDAVIGCDGIKSRTREIVVGQNHPSATSGYTHKFCYRGLIPMDQAIEVVGKERAMAANMWLAEDLHLITYPIAEGSICNAVMYRTDRDNWPSQTQYTLPAREEDLYSDSDGLNPRLRQLIKRMKTVDRWGVFDLADHPVPTFAKGRICLIGDAAHASTPHQGAGAGICIEDCAVLVALLADERVQNNSELTAAFAAFDASRRERGHWLVESSRRVGQLYEARSGISQDFLETERELKARAEIVWNFDIQKNIKESLNDLEKRLNSGTGGTNDTQGQTRVDL
ncbi:salicylate hydroxylase-like protein [Colletotrichum truncatum]|uniref:Salicylate hydroxylase-like protein n=1 Tax=Colletotrichum truncatum TaxID=5467 RepID=A0ACC3YSG7_COLTU|nr:salicylate hydroxylase-like protein [Colletotrichum truncatum]KAF6789749.1 salicylate hydroxylase-like protein [Colletotrichum truncatum]